MKIERREKISEDGSRQIEETAKKVLKEIDNESPKERAKRLQITIDKLHESSYGNYYLACHGKKEWDSLYKQEPLERSLDSLAMCEDAIVYPSEEGLMGIADGVGSAVDPFKASEKAVRLFSLVFDKSFREELKKVPNRKKFVEERAMNFIREASRIVGESATTFSGAIIWVDHNGEIKSTCVNIGDSRLYLETQEGEFKQLSYDHTEFGRRKYMHDQSLKRLKSIKSISSRLGNLSLEDLSEDFRFEKKVVPSLRNILALLKRDLEEYVEIATYKRNKEISKNDKWNKQAMELDDYAEEGKENISILEGEERWLNEELKKTNPDKRGIVDKFLEKLIEAEEVFQQTFDNHSNKLNSEWVRVGLENIEDRINKIQEIEKELTLGKPILFPSEKLRILNDEPNLERLFESSREIFLGFLPALEESLKESKENGSEDEVDFLDVLIKNIKSIIALLQRPLSSLDTQKREEIYDSLLKALNDTKGVFGLRGRMFQATKEEQNEYFNGSIHLSLSGDLEERNLNSVSLGPIVFTVTVKNGNILYAFSDGNTDNLVKMSEFIMGREAQKLQGLTSTQPTLEGKVRSVEQEVKRNLAARAISSTYHKQKPRKEIEKLIRDNPLSRGVSLDVARWIKGRDDVAIAAQKIQVDAGLIKEFTTEEPQGMRKRKRVPSKSPTRYIESTLSAANPFEMEKRLFKPEMDYKQIILQENKFAKYVNDNLFEELKKYPILKDFFDDPEGFIENLGDQLREKLEWGIQYDYVSIQRSGLEKFQKWQEFNQSFYDIYLEAIREEGRGLKESFQYVFCQLFLIKELLENYGLQEYLEKTSDNSSIDLRQLKRVVRYYFGRYVQAKDRFEDAFIESLEKF